MDARIRDLESARAGAYAGLQEQVRSLIETQQHLRAETGKLVNALRTPSVRGNWGEIQLRRVVEMAGMLDHCDFYYANQHEGEDGRLRPDLLVRLPRTRPWWWTPRRRWTRICAPWRLPTKRRARRGLADHARQVRAHMTALGRKSYWEQFDQAPEFAVLFLPGECFFSAALESDPSLIEFGVAQNIILATPSALISAAFSASFSCRQP